MAHCFECNAPSGYGHHATCSKYHEALAALRKKWRDLETPDQDCSSTATEDPARSEELTSPPHDGTVQGHGDTK